MKNITLYFALITVVFLGNSCATMAQCKYTSCNKKAVKLFEDGMQAVLNGKDDEALKKFKQAINIDSEFGEPYYIGAQLYEERRDYVQAIEYYKQALRISEKKFRAAYTLIGDLYFRQQKYGESLEFYDAFLALNNLKQEEWDTYTQKRRKAFVADSLMRNPVDFKPVNLGPKINSEFSEYHPSLTIDGEFIVYTVKAPTKYTSCQTMDGNDEEFFISRKVNGVWQQRVNPGPPLNSACNEGAANLSPDGRYIFFAAVTRDRENFYDGRQYSMDLYYAERRGDTWDKPKFLSGVNTQHFESQPSFSSDGKTLYFTSNRPGGLGGDDIWKTQLNDDGTWAEPENLGSTINTKGNEISPFIHPDNQTLYFASDGREGMGGFDFYVARKRNSIEFHSPLNLGYPVNTPYDERSLTISADGTTGYFASTNIEGFGKYDLYMFEMPSEFRPVQVTYLKGHIYDRKTGKPLQAQFELIDLSTGETTVKSNSDPVNGEFLVSIPSERMYALNVSKENYLFHSESFNLQGEHPILEPFVVDIRLQPVMVSDSGYVLKNVFFDTDKFILKSESYPELNKLVDLLNRNPKMKIEISGHTDNQGTKQHNQILSENRALAVYNYLISKGITSARLKYKGYGDSKPIADNATESGRALNRRTEFKVLSLE